MKIKTVRKIPFSEFIKEPEYVRLHIIPDSSVRNYRTEDIVKTISEQYKLPIDRFEIDGWKLKGFHRQEKTFFEIEFLNNEVNFYLDVAKKIVPLMKRRIMSVWDKATVEEVGPAKPFDNAKTSAYELLYRKHDLYSLHTDAKDNLPLGSLLEAGRLLSEGERASVFTTFEPIYQVGWQHEISAAWEKLRKGTVPRKLGSGGKEMAKFLAVGVTTILKEVITTLSDIMGSSEENVYTKKANDPEASMTAIYNLSEATKKKQYRNAVKVNLWTFAESEEEHRADMIARTLALSYGDLSGDNELEAKKVKGDKKAALVEAHRTKRNSNPRIKYNVMSSSEASKLCQLPGDELQQAYAEIVRVDQKEVEIANKALLDNSGLLVGKHH